MNRSTHYPSVDILRGGAAISVLVFHVIEYWGWTDFPRSGPLAWFRIGWLGVDLFFVISGFVIGLSALAEIERSGRNAFRQPFALRRMARIVPLHYLTCAVFVAVAISTPYEDLTENVMAHALFAHNLFPSLQGALNRPNWSLGAEMQFYILIAVIAPWLYGRYWWRVLLGMIAIAWAWRFAAFYVLPELAPRPGLDLWFLTTQMPGTLDEFAAGLLLARFVRSERGGSVLASMERRPILLVTALIGAGISFWSALLLYWSGPSFWQSVTTVTLIRAPLAISAMLLLLVVCGLNSQSWQRFTAPLRYLGKISYGIYLWHWSVLILLHGKTNLPPLEGLVYTSGISLTLASLSWHLVERPIINHYARRTRSNGLLVAK